MNCSRCGAALLPESRFCPQCGAPALDRVEPVAAERKRPGLVTLLAVLNLVAASCKLLVAISPFFVPPPGRTAMIPLAAVCLAWAALNVLCAVGLLKVARYGRTLQIVLSVIGLLEFPLGTVFHILILVYLFRPGIKILFSGRPLATLAPEEIVQVRAVSGSNFVAVAVVVAVLALGGVAYVGIIAAIAIPNLLNAIDRGKQKRTMADIRSIGTAIESYAVDNEFYPSSESLAELEDVLEPTYIRALPLADGWKNPFVFLPNAGTGYTLGSGGKDGGGLEVVGEGGATSSLNDAILYIDGEFVQWPE